MTENEKINVITEFIMKESNGGKKALSKIDVFGAVSSAIKEIKKMRKEEKENNKCEEAMLAEKFNEVLRGLKSGSVLPLGQTVKGNCLIDIADLPVGSSFRRADGRADGYISMSPTGSKWICQTKNGFTQASKCPDSILMEVSSYTIPSGAQDVEHHAYCEDLKMFATVEMDGNCISAGESIIAGPVTFEIGGKELTVGFDSVNVVPSKSCQRYIVVRCANPNPAYNADLRQLKNTFHDAQVGGMKTFRLRDKNGKLHPVKLDGMNFCHYGEWLSVSLSKLANVNFEEE